MGFYKGDWRPSSSKRGRWKENKTDGGGEPNHHYSNLVCSFSWHSGDKKKKKEQVSLLQERNLIIIVDNYTERHTNRQWLKVRKRLRNNNKCALSLLCPIEQGKQLFLCVSCSWKIKGTISFPFGKVTAGDAICINCIKCFRSERMVQSKSSHIFHT